LTVNTGAGPKSCLIDLAGVDAPRCD